MPTIDYDKLAAAILAAAPAAAAPAAAPLAPVAGRVFEGTHTGPSGKADGRRFLCGVDVACRKMTRSLEASQSHSARDAAFHVAEYATK